MRCHTEWIPAPPLRFWGEGAVGWYCLAGAVTRYLEYIGDPVRYEEVMGVSGAAWRLIWDPGRWSPDNLIMAWYGHLLAKRRIADAFGYEYEFLDRRRETPRTEANSEEAVAARIRAEIDAGRPAMAIGIAGPEECLVAGYREWGKTLLVQSFFERAEGYLEVPDWVDEASFLGLHLFVRRGARKTERQNLMEALAWAVEMGRMTEAGGRAAGLAAYEAWAQDMLRDEDFVGVDLETLQYNCMSISDNGIILLMARQAAADYLEMMQAQVGSRARQHLLAAAELHRQESKTMGAAHDAMPWGNVHGEELLRRLERSNREHLAQVILQCKVYYAQAMGEMEKALQAEGHDRGTQSHRHTGVRPVGPTRAKGGDDMIELPEATVIAQQIGAELTGKRIEAGNRGNATHKFAFSSGSAEEYETILKDKTVGPAVGHGGAILVPLEPGYMLVLGGGGERILYHPSDSRLPKKYHLLLRFTDGTCLTVTVQGWGNTLLLPEATTGEHRHVQMDRIAPLSAGFTWEYFHSLFEEVDAESSKSVKYFLISEPGVWGIGNGSLQDILYRARIHPRRRVVDVTEDEGHALYDAIVDTLSQMVELGGRYEERDLYGNRGGYVRMLDSKTRGKPCPECGTLIERAQYLGGAIYFCPTCQT